MNRIKRFTFNLFQSESREHEPNHSFLILTGAILFFGLLMLMSASSVFSYRKFGTSYYMFWHQIISGFIPGLLAFYICSKIDYRKWKRIAPVLLFFSIFLLLVVFIPGIGRVYNGSRSWISIFGISIQPAEIVKFIFIIYLASWIDSRGEKIKDFETGFLPFLFVLGIIMGLMFLQPDFGTMVIIILISIACFFIGEGNLKHIFYLGCGFLLMVFAAVKIAPYRLSRFLVFLNPNTDIRGVGYHLNQALIAVGSGGIFGLGLGQSRQKYGYLPEVSGDSIFAIMAEEIGFVFCLFYIFLLFLLVSQGIKLARSCDDKYSRVLVSGIIVWIGFQSFINIGSVIGLMPMTGVPLPFVSYGGTAMVSNLAAMGILFNISKFKRC